MPRNLLCTSPSYTANHVTASSRAARAFHFRRLFWRIRRRLRLCARFTARIRLRLRPIACRQYGLWLRLCARFTARIRLRLRPISLSLNTVAFVARIAFRRYGLWAPYFACAQYGLLVTRGCAALTPGCILAPLQGALFPLAQLLTSATGRCPLPIVQLLTSATGRCPFPLAQFPTSATGRCPLPIAIYGEGVADRPGGRPHSPSPHIRPQHDVRPPPYRSKRVFSTIKKSNYSAAPHQYG